MLAIRQLDGKKELQNYKTTNPFLSFISYQFGAKFGRSNDSQDYFKGLTPTLTIEKETLIIPTELYAYRANLLMNAWQENGRGI